MVIKQVNKRDRIPKIKNIPKHVVIIPDGNRRWARKHGLASVKGHWAGTRNAEDIIEAGRKMGVKYGSIWGSSVSNLKNRSVKEVKVLFEVYRKKFDEYVNKKKIMKNKIRIQVFGSWEKYLPKDLVDRVREVVSMTKKNNRYFLSFFIAYDGKEEMQRAVCEILAKKKKGLRVTSSEIKRHLYTRNLPPVDLVIRTGGEPHWSAGFMMWDIADAQFYFTRKLWPDFTKRDFIKSLQDYSRRGRRYGS